MSSGTLSIVLILFAMLCISTNDMLIKGLSDSYPLHQIVFIRSVIGILFTVVFVQLEGGWSILRTRRPGLHIVRAILLVGANLLFFAGLASSPLAEVNAVFFVAPLMITLLSIPVLGQQVGFRRISACAIGFLGVLIMLSPGSTSVDWNYLLPLGAAACYAGMQVLTKYLGAESKASAMAFYLQAMFILVSVGFWLVVGDGRYAAEVDHPSLQFLLRAWHWPEGHDIWVFVLIGTMVGLLSYAMSQAYRLGDPATIAPFEYVAMPIAVFWGYVIFGELPDIRGWFGIVLITGSGLFVFLRERQRQAPPSRAGRQG